MKYITEVQAGQVINSGTFATVLAKEIKYKGGIMRIGTTVRGAPVQVTTHRWSNGPDQPPADNVPEVLEALPIGHKILIDDYDSNDNLYQSWEFIRVPDGWRCDYVEIFDPA